jgi:hypothetical protein
MKLSDGTILMHAGAPYDPKKAHDYYERTKKLKGRKKGSAKPPSATNRAGAKPPVKKHTQVKDLSPQQKKELQAYAAQKVQEAQKKLNELNRKLKDKLAEAKKAERDAKKPKTASEKAKDARESKKYRDKHQTEVKTKAKAKREASKASGKDDSSSDSVAGLKKQIATAEKALNTAKAKAKALA